MSEDKKPLQNDPRRSIRCGWCINGDHQRCAVAIDMGDVKRGFTVWRCPCPAEGHPASRCTQCKRTDIEVTTDKSQCLDAEDCRTYRATRRAQDPAFRAIDEITATLAQGSDQSGSETPRKAGRGPKKPTEGECVCCGGATRGGKFLPGHDARYVSQQAAAYVAQDGDGKRGTPKADATARAIYDAMEKLGPALHAKFVKRVEKTRAATKEEVKAS